MSADAATEQKDKQYTKKEVSAFLADIAQKVVESDTACTHSMLALDHLLRQPNADKIFDENLKAQARDLWIKIKSSGFELADPPFLFGYPEPEIETQQVDDDDVEDGTDEVVIDMRLLEEKTERRKREVSKKEKEAATDMISEFMDDDDIAGEA